MTALLAWSTDTKTTEDTKGKFTSDNVYNNSALGMTIALPGAWRFAENKKQDQSGTDQASQATVNADCRGPFCSGTQVDVQLISNELVPKGAIFLIAYKLSPEYLDRRRYPLKRFADAMATNSVGDSGWIISGELTAIELDKRPAYRLLVHKPQPIGQGIGFGYVAESNGYVFLLVGCVPNLIPDYPKALQSAIESMKLGVVGGNK
jgi:hypothetical protein